MHGVLASIDIEMGNALGRVVRTSQPAGSMKRTLDPQVAAQVLSIKEKGTHVTPQCHLDELLTQ